MPEGELSKIRVDKKDSNEMHLIERMQVKPTEKLSKICHLAKDIYNKANYIMRHYFFMVLESEDVDLEWLEKTHHHMVSTPHDFDNVVKITKVFLERAKIEIPIDDSDAPLRNEKGDIIGVVLVI